jgi:hypothetical protein
MNKRVKYDLIMVVLRAMGKKGMEAMNDIDVGDSSGFSWEVAWCSGQSSGLGEGN